MINMQIVNRITVPLFIVFLLFFYSCEDLRLHTEMNFTLTPSDSLQLLKINGSTEIELNPNNFDGSNITVTWSANTGMIVGHGLTAIYTAPSEPCTAIVQTLLTDEYDLTIMDSLVIIVYKQLIILKADDLIYSSGYIIPLGFQRFIDYVEQKKIMASIGIIGNSLEIDNDDYFTILRDIINDGSIEFWNHGFDHKLNGVNQNGETYHEFWNTSYEYQKEHLEKTQDLAREKLGISLRAFGAPGNNHDSVTLDVINGNDEIKIWFYGNPESNKLILERHYNIEFPTSFPDYEEFVDNYPNDEEYLALQIHPNVWDDERFDQFNLIVDYLIQQRVAFVTPYQFYRLVQR